MTWRGVAGLARGGGIERGCDVPVDVMSRTSDIDRREVRPTMTTAGHVRKVRGRPAAGQLPQDCPYCEETLENAPWGWVCARCHSTIGSRTRWPCELDPDRVGLRPGGPVWTHGVGASWS
jgi:hypothetical protein